MRWCCVGKITRKNYFFTLREMCSSFLCVFEMLFLLFTLNNKIFPFCSPAPSPHPSVFSGHHQHCCLCLRVIHIRTLANPFFFHPVPRPLSCHSVLCIYASVFILFISLFCSLDSTYR